MQSNDKKISGVLHPNSSAQHFQLRRYLPESTLAPLIEQFWLVDWDLRGQQPHNQQNLPDPNMHLVISQQGAKVLGPVSKKYHYCMQGQGKIIGVKFNLGVLAKRLPCPIDKAVDTEFEAADILLFDQQKLVENTLNADCDKDVVTHLDETLRKIVMPQDSALSNVQALAEQMKNNNEIKRVEMLADISRTSVRTLQRLFKTYVSLPPKWLIRKYRLSHALEMLENRQLSLTELAANLDYADQSHLIRDFNGFLDITLSNIRKPTKLQNQIYS
ncbi:helix-turn-helix transcriptional regulator [uncultured Paraglaciecola sp.]|uniref:helix-turn-helix transcriptional regulator n=1 Tax=uncultured Paraglaciecola sp. TaxID=1765024 RepID=UPI0025EC2B63|nr:helix-turn-helix transcriptional regulator [uncultured Paraglaciecola sp.]